jgi:hypothetical protein
MQIIIHIAAVKKSEDVLTPFTGPFVHTACICPPGVGVPAKPQTERRFLRRFYMHAFPLSFSLSSRLTAISVTGHHEMEGLTIGTKLDNCRRSLKFSRLV